MCTARPGWQSITLQQQHYKKRMYNIRIDLPDIIKIDEENKYVRVEPMVTIGKENQMRSPDLEFQLKNQIFVWAGLETSNQIILKQKLKKKLHSEIFF